MRKRKMYLSVEDIAELFGLSVSFAYRVVERMNADLASKNYYVILGRVPTRYVEDKIYGLEHVEQYLNIGTSITPSGGNRERNKRTHKINHNTRLLQPKCKKIHHWHHIRRLRHHTESLPGQTASGSGNPGLRLRFRPRYKIFPGARLQSHCHRRFTGTMQTRKRIYRHSGKTHAVPGPG